MSGKWVYTDMALIAAICGNGRAGSLYLINAPKNYDEEPFIQPVMSEEEREELRRFQDELSFTLAKLENGYDILRHVEAVGGHGELSVTVVSNSPIRIVDTGVKAGEGGIYFPLLPDD